MLSPPESKSEFKSESKGEHEIVEENVGMSAFHIVDERMFECFEFGAKIAQNRANSWYKQ